MLISPVEDISKPKCLQPLQTTAWTPFRSYGGHLALFDYPDCEGVGLWEMQFWVDSKKDFYWTTFIYLWSSGGFLIQSPQKQVNTKGRSVVGKC